MKKKSLALLLSMLVCLFSLTACTPTELEVTDTSITEGMKSNVDGIVEEIVGMDEATLDAMIEYFGVDGMSPNKGQLSGLESWKSSKEDLGEFKEIKSYKVVQNTSDKSYVASAEIAFEKRDCEFKLIVDKRLQEIVSITFNPDFTFGEKMTKAAMNTLMGIGTVFMMLVLISLIIYCFKFINAWETKKKEAKAPAAPAPAPAPAPAAPELTIEEPVIEEDLSDDLELVAVITAAIAASEGTSTDGLIVRSIKRTGSNKWKRA